jgi:hypothetical protein
LRGGDLAVGQRGFEFAKKWGARPIICDFDDTLVKGEWPAIGEYMPGAVEAMHTFHTHGIPVWVHSCRLSPFMPDHETERDPAEVQAEILRVRDTLDEAGLPFVGIFTKPGKPSGFVYIDDKAERYGGGANSWKKLVPKVLARRGIDVPDPD